MISDTDWTLLMEKLDAIDKRLNTLENEIKILQRQTPIPAVWPNDPTKVSRQTECEFGTFHKGAILQRPCIFDSLPPEDRMKPMGISCSCPKCSPYCLSDDNSQTIGECRGSIRAGGGI